MEDITKNRWLTWELKVSGTKTSFLYYGDRGSSYTGTQNYWRIIVGVWISRYTCIKTYFNIYGCVGIFFPKIFTLVCYHMWILLTREPRTVEFVNSYVKEYFLPSSIQGSAVFLSGISEQFLNSSDRRFTKWYCFSDFFSLSHPLPFRVFSSPSLQPISCFALRHIVYIAKRLAR